VSSQGTDRPFCIEKVFLFDREDLHAELERRGVQMGYATSVYGALWTAAEIYPASNNPLLVISELHRQQLKLFAYESLVEGV
jgi:hypothetical protein